ncbi:MAG: hypothetical protein ACOYM9_18820 [Bradymonadia bacterium]
MVIGNQFVSAVLVDGRVTAELAEGEVWLYGVYPGAIAETGADLPSAFANLREAIRKVLIDFATQRPDFADFRTEVERFFHETSPDSVAEWDEARLQIRAGREHFGALPQDTSNRTPKVEVAELRLRPEANPVVGDPSPQVAA